MRYLLPAALGLFVVSAPPAFAYTQDDANACSNDAFRLCGEAIPDQQRIVQCLYQKRRQLSPACYAVYLRYAKEKDNRASFAAKNLK
jgi:hypothetical protein